MNKQNNTYDKAVRAFLEMADAPLTGRYTTPHAISADMNLPSSSGYRNLYSLESAGILKRNSLGAYQRGDQAIRIGLSACGLGHLAVISHPILEQLRRVSGLTAFIGLLTNRSLIVGPFSFGSSTSFIIPESQSHEILHQEILHPGQFALSVSSGEKIVSALATVVSDSTVEKGNAVTGVFYKQNFVLNIADTRDALDVAVSRLQSVSHT